jgi:hypothetical protein
MEQLKVLRPKIDQIMRAREPNWDKLRSGVVEEMPKFVYWMKRIFVEFTLENNHKPKYVFNDLVDLVRRRSTLLFHRKTPAADLAMRAFLIGLTDQSSWACAEVMSKYWQIPEVDRKVYVFAKGFFDEFSKVTLDNLQFRHIPVVEPICIRYPTDIEDQDGDRFSEVYVYTGNMEEVAVKRREFIDSLGELLESAGAVTMIKPPTTDDEGRKFYTEDDKNWIGFAYPVSNAASFGCSMVPRSVDPETPVRVSYKNSIRIVGGEFNGVINKRVIEEDGYARHNAILYNSLAYIGSGQPDIREFRNQIHYRGHSKEKVVRADVDLTPSNVVLVGYGFKKERNTTDDAWYSSEHLGWRHCGPGRSQVRLVCVKGSYKKWQASGLETHATT